MASDLVAVTFAISASTLTLSIKVRNEDASSSDIKICAWVLPKSNEDINTSNRIVMHIRKEAEPVDFIYWHFIVTISNITLGILLDKE